MIARESTVQIPGMGESAVNDTEADEMEEHLRGLGYIEQRAHLGLRIRHRGPRIQR